VLQERILATRILHVTKNEVVFECKTGRKRECTSIGLRGEAFIKAYYQELFAGNGYVNSWVGWRIVVANYSKNHLTDSRDVLPALAGVSSRLQCSEFGKFLAGLWETELIHGLFWYTKVSAPIAAPLYTAPSFSWASLIGRAKFEDLQWTDKVHGSSDISVTQFKIFNATCRVNWSNAYGEVSEGCVELEAECSPVEIIGHHQGKDYPHMRIRYQAAQSIMYQATWSIAPQESSSLVFLDCCKTSVENVTNQNLTFITGWFNHWGSGLTRRTTMNGLILKRISRDSVFRRIGYFEGLLRPENYPTYGIKEDKNIV
jgi:hypothetical protein